MTDLRQLRALTAVVDEGTFTDAAIALRTSQASVSRAVAELERTLGVRLLLRTSQGARPTVLGRRVTEHARRVLAEIELIERLGEQPRPAPGGLRLVGVRAADHRRSSASGRPSTGAVTFVQSNTPTAGLLEGEVDLAVVRRPLDDQRFETSLVGAEKRCAALAVDDPLVRRRRLSLADLSQRPVAIDRATGTTSTELWPTGAAPTEVHEVHGMEEWLTVVAAGAAVGITSEATADQFPHPGLRYRPVVDAPPIAVWLVWWRDDPPAGAAAFRRLVCERYAERP